VKSIGGSIAANRACALVVPGAALDPHRLGDGDLHVVDHLAVPDGLEDPVREPQRHEVLHRLLAEVVVDPEHLVLAEPALHHRAQLAGRRKVVPEGLLDDHPRPALALASLADLSDDRRERLGRDGEVVEAVAPGPAGAVELLQGIADEVLAGVVVELRRDVPDAPCE
jgi:hypothetical protein